MHLATQVDWLAGPGTKIAKWHEERVGLRMLLSLVVESALSSLSQHVIEWAVDAVVDRFLWVALAKVLSLSRAGAESGRKADPDAESSADIVLESVSLYLVLNYVTKVVIHIESEANWGYLWHLNVPTFLF